MTTKVAKDWSSTLAIRNFIEFACGYSPNAGVHRIYDIKSKLENRWLRLGNFEEEETVFSKHLLNLLALRGINRDRFIAYINENCCPKQPNEPPILTLKYGYLLVFTRGVTLSEFELRLRFFLNHHTD